MARGDSWRDRVMSATATGLEQRPPAESGGRFPLAFRTGAHRLIERAAQQRGASISTYVRRSVLAMVAYDLGMSLEEVLEFDPRAASIGAGGYGTLEPEGQLFGPWRIMEVEQ